MCRMTTAEATCQDLCRKTRLIRTSGIVHYPPWKVLIHPEVSDPPPSWIGINLGDLPKAYRMSTLPKISDCSLIPNISLACMPGPCGPKKAKFGRSLLLCHSPAFSSLSPQLSLRSNPSFCKEMGSLWRTDISCWVSLTFQNNSWAKWVGMNASLFVNMVNKTGRKYHWAHFLAKKMGCSLTTIEKNAGKWQSNRFLQNDAFFGGSGSKHASKTHTQKNIQIKHRGKIYLPTKCRGAAKRWLLHKALPFCMDIVLLAPIHFCWFFARPRGL